MIKAIIFDVGGVLTHMDWNLFYSNFAQRIGISPQIITNFHEKNLDPLLLGNISFNDLLIKVGAVDVEQGKTIWFDEAKKLVQINKEVMALVDNLHKKYKVLILTNNSESRIPIDEYLDIYSHFDHVFLSSREHLIKPNEKFFRLALEKYSLAPEEAVFVDDTIKHVTAAQQIGINGIIFQDCNQLKINLSELGIKI